jgi:hypothetical protein
MAGKLCVPTVVTMERLSHEYRLTYAYEIE